MSVVFGSCYIINWNEFNHLRKPKCGKSHSNCENGLWKIRSQTDFCIFIWWFVVINRNERTMIPLTCLRKTSCDNYRKTSESCQIINRIIIYEKACFQRLRAETFFRLKKYSGIGMLSIASSASNPGVRHSGPEPVPTMYCFRTKNGCGRNWKFRENCFEIHFFFKIGIYVFVDFRTLQFYSNAKLKKLKLSSTSCLHHKK